METGKVLFPLPFITIEKDEKLAWFGVKATDILLMPFTLLMGFIPMSSILLTCAFLVFLGTTSVLQYLDDLKYSFTSKNTH